MNIFVYVVIFYPSWSVTRLNHSRKLDHCSAGFSLTFEVEGHCLVNRRVPYKIEGRRPEPLGGSGGRSPSGNF